MKCQFPIILTGQIQVQGRIEQGCKFKVTQVDEDHADVELISPYEGAGTVVEAINLSLSAVTGWIFDHADY